MATTWEYLRTSASARVFDSEGGTRHEALELAEEAWEAKLNEFGQAGWELVTEQLTSGGAGSASDPLWAKFTGTMKRSGSSL